MSFFEMIFAVIGAILNKFKSAPKPELESSKVAEPALAQYTEGTLPWYRQAYHMLTIPAKFEASVAAAGRKIIAGRDAYESVAKVTQVPWFVIGAIHLLESGCNFKACLHNGEQIIGTGKKTRLVPAGRGPFATWGQAALDAINMNQARWAKVIDAGNDISEILYAAERYNGTGYLTGAGKNVVSPYLWARSSVIGKGLGKYIADGKFDPKADANAQVGFATVLKWLEGQDVISFAPQTDVSDAAPPADMADVLRDIAAKNAIPAGAIERLIRVSASKYPDARPRYWGVFDLTQHSRNRRFYLIDIVSKSVKRHYCSHGSGSDRNNDGIADRFSNENGSNCSSLGVCRVSETYYGAHGLSVRLDGLEPSNSNVRSRAVVIHGALYAGETFVKLNGRAGRSNGCLAFGDDVKTEIVNALKGGSFVINWGDQT